MSQVTYNADGTTEDAYYGYDQHTDVETLTDKSGDTKATYGYTAYGKNDDAQFTGIDKPDTADPTKEPYNAYRFNAKRWDQSSESYDMGFRDYSPGLNRFLSRDSYNGALADMGLSLDPWTGNRYSFGGGNPISMVELDGHISCGSVLGCFGKGLWDGFKSSLYTEACVGDSCSEGSNPSFDLSAKGIFDAICLCVEVNYEPGRDLTPEEKKESAYALGSGGGAAAGVFLQGGLAKATLKPGVKVYVKVNGVWRYVYRAIDQYGQVIDVLLSARRDCACRISRPCSSSGVLVFVEDAAESVSSAYVEVGRFVPDL